MTIFNIKNELFFYLNTNHNYIKMGIYWCSYIYFGRILCKETYERIKNHPLFNKEFIKIINNERYLLHLHFSKIGWIDPIFEEHEIMNKFVAWSEVGDFCNKKGWQTVDIGKLEAIKTLIKDCAKKNETNLEPNYYICQSIYDGIEDKIGRVDRNMIIKDCPYDYVA
jgi:hypothetical protein